MKLNAAFRLSPLKSAAWRWFIALGAALSLASPPALAAPLLFNSDEKPAADIGAFTNWTGMLARHGNDEEDCEGRRQCAWITFLDSLNDLPRQEQIRHVNRYHNQQRYIQDIVNWGVNDYWATLLEFLRKDGDCEDYAIAKYMALRRLGFTTDDMRIVVLLDTNLGVMHAVLAVYEDDTIYILDNQAKAVLDHTRIRHYQPVYSINEDAWWRHLPRG